MLSLENPDFDFFFRSASGSECRVTEEELSSSFIVAPTRLIRSWPVTTVASLSEDTLAPVLELSPEVIVLGTGESQVFPSVEIMRFCASRRIGLEVMNNASAARTFNILAGEGRHVVAAMIVGS